MAGKQDIVVRLLGDIKGLERALAQAVRATDSVGQKMKKTGAIMSATVTPAAGALAVAFKKSFDEFDTGSDALRVKTGLMGKDLAGLEKNFKDVAGQVVQPLSEVGNVMGELAARTNLTGKPLEQLTKQVLDLARITGGDAQASVANLTRLFGDWSIKTSSQAGTLDKLFRVSQKSGIEVNRLSELMVQFGSPLRSLGLDFDTTAAMFARFEKEGVNIETAMPGLRMALKNFAKAGREPAEALKDTIEKIKNTRSEADATKLAFKTFGVRAGADLGRAIREGRFSLEDYIASMKNGRDTIAKATKDTDDWSETFAKLRNRISVVLGPIGQIGSVVAGGVAALGPMIFGLGTLTTALQGSAVASRIAALAMDSIPFVAIAAAVVLLAVLIVKNWKTIKRVTLAVFHAIGRVIGDVIDWVKKHWPLLLAVLIGPIGLAVLFIVKHFKKIKEVAAGAVKWVKDRFSSFVEFFKNLPGKIGRAARGMWDGIKDAFRAAVNFIIRGWNRIEFKIPGFKVGPIKWKGFKLGLPDIPLLAKGGIVTKPTLAMVGERGPEAVIPLGRRGGGVGAVVNHYHIDVDVPPTANKAAIGAEIVKAIKAFEKGNGPRWRGAA